MAQSRVDRMMGRDLWKALHIIAINFPDGKKDGLSEQRLKGFFDFFNSLKHVLPRSAWRETWSHITAGGDTELSWESFKFLRDHRNLSRWLFAVHDGVNEDLKKPRSKISYAKLYASYRKFRKGVRQSNLTDTNSVEDPIGIAKLKAMLQTRSKAMDTYLTSIHGEIYKTWPQTRKEAARKSQLTEAAVWFYTRISNHAAKSNSTFNSLNSSQRRNRVLTQFDFNFRLRHQRAMNSVLGVKGRILNALSA